MHLTASGFILLSVNFNVLDESNLFDIGQGRTWGKGNPIDQVPSLCAWGGGQGVLCIQSGVSLGF